MSLTLISGIISVVVFIAIAAYNPGKSVFDK